MLVGLVLFEVPCALALLVAAWMRRAALTCSWLISLRYDGAALMSLAANVPRMKSTGALLDVAFVSAVGMFVFVFIVAVEAAAGAPAPSNPKASATIGSSGASSSAAVELRLGVVWCAVALLYYWE